MKFLVLLVLLFVSLGARALEPGDRIDNFRLLDHRGVSHELHYLSDRKAVVIMVHGNGCPVVRQALPALRAVRERFEREGVAFLLLDSHRQDDRAAVTAEAAEFGIDLPVLLDETQLVGESLGVTRTAEVFVIDPGTWTLVYRGPVDDRLAYGAQKPAAARHYLSDALAATLAGQAAPVKKVAAVGCLVDFPERERRAEHARISYAEAVAPILRDRCSVCHRPGGVAPWAMTGYPAVRGFAPMIREVLRTKRMPPWYADPQHGHFVGDLSLTPEEVRTVVHWIEAGAPRGEGPDPLAAVTAADSEWPLGPPDLVVEIPAYEVPATGVVDYLYPQVRNPLTEDKWVRAIHILPGSRAVVHHVLAGIDDPAMRGQRPFIEQLAAFGGYSPGRNFLPFPDGSGVRLRAGADLLFQLHYTPNGKAVRDVTRVGFYFHAQPPQHEMRLQFLMTRGLSIPPHAKAHAETVVHTFERDVVLYSLMPHAHLRGKAAKFTAVFPDGREETLLSVPRYDFNWQTVYVLSEPRPLPAGTQVTFEMVWDNSAQNPANPDPSRTVPWGDQTWDEMNAGWIRYREIAPARTASER